MTEQLTLDLDSTLEDFSAKSLELQELLRKFGYANGDGVSNQGLVRVAIIARRLGIRDWPNTQTLADYDRLIAAVRESLEMQAESLHHCLVKRRPVEQYSRV